MNTGFQVNIEATSVRRQVEAQLRLAITQGVFSPGDHLSDRVLQERFGVSRTVVREAMRQLEAEGLVETIPHRGSFVRKLSAEEARQIYAVRSVLEALAARGFARHASEDQITALQDALDELKRQMEQPEDERLVEIKQRFYEALLDGCGNEHVQRMLNQLLNHNSQLRRTSLSAPDRLPQTVEELSRLLEAVRRRDEDAAWAASLAHVRNAAAVALHILDDEAEFEAG